MLLSKQYNAEKNASKAKQLFCGLKFAINLKKISFHVRDTDVQISIWCLEKAI